MCKVTICSIDKSKSRFFLPNRSLHNEASKIPNKPPMYIKDTTSEASEIVNGPVSNGVSSDVNRI